MKDLIRLEEAAMFGFSIYMFSITTFDWWWFPALILAPDLSFIGYVVNTKVGAITYNFVHHKAVAIVVLIIGLYISNDILTLTGIILFGHSSMDRLLGYGFKYFDSFKHTHLGVIAKERSR